MQLCKMTITLNEDSEEYFYEYNVEIHDCFNNTTVTYKSEEDVLLYDEFINHSKEVFSGILREYVGNQKGILIIIYEHSNENMREVGKIHNLEIKL